MGAHNGEENNGGQHWTSGVVSWGQLLLAIGALLIALAGALVALESRLTRLEVTQAALTSTDVKQDSTMLEYVKQREAAQAAFRDDVMHRLDEVTREINATKIELATHNADTQRALNGRR